MRFTARSYYVRVAHQLITLLITIFLLTSFCQSGALAAVFFPDDVKEWEKNITLSRDEEDFTIVLSSDQGDRFEIDADKVIYDDMDGIATAVGNVEARGSGMRLMAPSAVYDTRAGMIAASSSGDENVTLITDKLKLIGHSVEYNLNTREGTLTRPSGQVDAVFFKGGDVVVMPREEAVRKKLVTAAEKHSDEMIAFWSNPSATTCNFSEPHYHLISKKAIIYQNRKVVLKRPDVYMGQRMIFQYPFDYIIPLTKRGNGVSLMPRLLYSSDNGVGLGITGPVVWDSGQIDISTAYWTNGIWEADLEISQRLGRDFTLYAKSARLYNKDDKDTQWRPSWGITYKSLDGWTARLYESQRELVETEMRPGQDRRYNLWRSPEFEFSSPWFKLIPSHFFRFSGIWGKYQDNMTHANQQVERLAGRIDLYGEPSIGVATLKPFYRASYRYFDYKHDDSTQKVTDLVAGFHWYAGSLTFSTAYVRRWVDGRSPFSWDNYLSREDLYQRIAYAFPGTREWERWKISVRAGYDFIDQRLNEMVYAVSYNKHCLTWELYARDSRPKNEVSVGLRFIINAYPDQVLTLGESDIYDPYRRPVPNQDWNNK